MNKNRNGLLRQNYPKGTNFVRLSQTHINRVVEQLNNRPGKRLGYRTPAEVFWGGIYWGTINERCCGYWLNPLLRLSSFLPFLKAVYRKVER